MTAIQEGIFKAFLNEFGGIYVTRKTLVFIYQSLLGTTRYGFDKTFKAMKKTFEKEIQQRNLISPGTNAIPKSIVISYLEASGINEEKIVTLARDYFEQK